MNNFKANYERILEVLRKISTDQQLPMQRRRPTMSDLEVISLSLTAEYMGIDSENHPFRILPSCFRSRIERAVFNRGRRRLMPYQNAIRMKLAESFNEFEDVFIVNSMPSKGYCASKKTYYYGYKLHAVCSVKDVFQTINLMPANVHDIHNLKDIKDQLSDCTLLGDKGYLSSGIQLNLFKSSNIRMDTPKRTNQKKYKPQFGLSEIKKAY